MNSFEPTGALKELIDAVGKALEKENLEYEKGNDQEAHFILLDRKLGLVCQIAWKRERVNLDAFFTMLRATLKRDATNLLVVNDEIDSRDFSAWTKFRDEDRYFDRIGLCKLSELPEFLREVLDKIADDALLEGLKRNLGVE